MSDERKTIINTNGEPLDVEDAVEKATFFAKGAQQEGLPIDAFWPMMAKIGLEPKDGRSKGPILMKAGIRKIEAGNEERYVYKDFAPPKAPRQNRKGKTAKNASPEEQPDAIPAPDSDEVMVLLGGIAERLDKLPEAIQQMVAQQLPSEAAPETSSEVMKALGTVSDQMQRLASVVQTLAQQQQTSVSTPDSTPDVKNLLVEVMERLESLTTAFKSVDAQQSAEQPSDEESDTFNLRGGSVNFDAPGRMSGQVENVKRIVIYYMPEDNSN